MKTIIHTNNLCKSFSAGGKQLHIIKNLDLAIEEGAFTVIMGSSGSGKSTLLYAVSGMDKPTLGEVVWFETENIAKYTNDELAAFRRKNCGFVFQQIHLIDSMSVMDNIIANGLLLTGNKKAIYARAVELLEQVKLGEELWDKFPSQLSGGEAQRVGIVRALINRPVLLFADEPTGALNSAAGAAVLDVLSGFHNRGQSLVMVTHDLKTALRGNRIIYLRDGAVSGRLELPPYEPGTNVERKTLSTTEFKSAKADMEYNAGRMDILQKFLERMGW